MSTTAATAFEAIDVNHDGVISQAEFAGALATGSIAVTSPVIYSSPIVSAPATYVTAAPATTITRAAPVYTSPVTTSVAAPVTMSVAAPVATSIAAPVFAEPVVTQSAPVTYISSPQPVTTPAPVTYISSPTSYTTAPMPVTYISTPTAIPAAAPTGALTLYPGLRIIYTSKTTGTDYPGEIVERNGAGWLIKLDVDGGVKEVPDLDLLRIKPESPAGETGTAASTAAPAHGAAPAAHAAAPADKPAAAPVKEAKEKKSKKVSTKKKGCC
eukprot:TRINITY_DN9_c0_g2_i1.p1 TRINITY_DN9_c0_g2~~TRINITY_DN9_c0_g2_i1.p1  ORF type:complete len:296 (-),score=73.53 TRINITY_DN9_c0_g2_i1:279-1088(-)